jgi:uncharacterized OsmC-like protein
MADIETTTVSEDGFASTSQAGGFELVIDATGEDGPDPNQTLVATYAACYLPAFRVGAEQRGHDDHDLADISFQIHVEADLDDETADEIAARADDICHVHTAVREGLQADVTVATDAF